MKLLILSDLHLESEPFELPQGVDFDVAILAGDIARPGRLGVNWARSEIGPGTLKPVLIVPGNHEYYSTIMETELRLMRQYCEGTNVQVLDGDEVVIGGVRFLGCTLWTDFRLRINVVSDLGGGRTRMISDMGRAMTQVERGLNDYRLIGTQVDNLDGRMLRTADTLRIHRQQRNWLRRRLAEPFEGPTVVITHHAPHRKSLEPRHAQSWNSPGFVSELPPDYFKVPVLWIHGHTHSPEDYQIGSCRVFSNPRGYVRYTGETENRQFDAMRVIDLGQVKPTKPAP